MFRLSSMLLLPLCATALSLTTTTQRASTALRSAIPEGMGDWQGGNAQFNQGAGVGRLVLDDTAQNSECLYDMVLVERIQGKAKTESGLFVPDEDLPKLHLCKVISMGPGREEENGMVAPMPNIAVGDVVIAKNPWGIGPKDEETAEGRKLSFMRSQDIAAVVTGGLLD